MLHLADTGEVKCLDFGGFAPHDFTIDQWGTPPRYQYRDVGSSVFPGTLTGWTEVLERHGTRSLSQTLGPAIEYARRGVPARPVVIDFIARLESEMPPFSGACRDLPPRGPRPPPGTDRHEPGSGRYLRRDRRERDGALLSSSPDSAPWRETPTLRLASQAHWLTPSSPSFLHWSHLCRLPNASR